MILRQLSERELVTAMKRIGLCVLALAVLGWLSTDVHAQAADGTTATAVGETATAAANTATAADLIRDAQRAVGQVVKAARDDPEFEPNTFDDFGGMDDFGGGFDDFGGGWDY